MAAIKNARHEAFAQALAKGKTSDEAYVIAGYTENRGNAARLKANEHILSRVAELSEKAAERAEIDIARTLRELVRIGTADVRKLFDDRGNLRPVTELDDDTAAAISSVEVVVRPGDDESRRPEHVHKFRMWDKNSALEKIAKHLGMFVDRVEHGGFNGGPIQVASIDTSKLSTAALQELLSVRRNQAV